MGEKTGIAWTDHTFNPWWGCVKVSPGCANCYAETEAHRRGFDVWGPKGQRRQLSQAYWKEPERWNRAAEKEGRRHRVFCASMADVFESLDPPMDGGDLRSYDMENERLRLWDLIERTPWLDWQLLTKRPENIRGMLPKAWLVTPRPNVWLGVSAEDQARADERIPILLQTPAAVRFVSAEPLLGPIVFKAPEVSEWPEGKPTSAVANPAEWDDWKYWMARDRGIKWVIVGGESGTRARRCYAAWVRSILAQCKAAGVAVFMKQLGASFHDPEHNNEWSYRDRKGADPMEWPEDLRVQEFPR